MPSKASVGRHGTRGKARSLVTEFAASQANKTDTSALRLQPVGARLPLALLRRRRIRTGIVKGLRTLEKDMKLRIIFFMLLAVSCAAQVGPTPTFEDHFNTGVLNTKVWIVSNWGAPGGGVFRPANINLSQGLLRISLTQTENSNGSISSVGGELQSKAAYGYGTYEWTMRMSSTSPTKNGYGQITSGQISSGFTFINNSQTEIDYEVEGQFPNRIEMTNWKGLHAQQYTSSFLQSPEAGFHKYRFVWSASKIVFYVDGLKVSTHTLNIPSAAAYVMINHWGTNSTGFGGLATPGVERYMYVSSFKFWAQ